MCSPCSKKYRICMPAVTPSLAGQVSPLPTPSRARRARDLALTSAAHLISLSPSWRWGRLRTALITRQSVPTELHLHPNLIRRPSSKTTRNRNSRRLLGRTRGRSGRHRRGHLPWRLDGKSKLSLLEVSELSGRDNLRAGAVARERGSVISHSLQGEYHG